MKRYFCELLKWGSILSIETKKGADNEQSSNRESGRREI